MGFKFTSVMKLAALSVVAVSAAPVLAQSAGDTIVSAGWFHVSPRDSSTPLNINSPAVIAGPVVGSGASVDDVDTAGVSISYFFTDHWAASIDLGLPPRYKLKGSGTFSAVGEIGSAKQWAPALVGKYYFGDGHTQFRPFLGLGVTRVSYSSTQLNSSFQQFIGTSFFDPAAVTTVDLKSSWAPVYTAGLSYAINRDWYANFSVSYVRLKTDADLVTNTNTLGQVRSSTTLTLNPVVTYLTLGYRF